MRTTIYKLVGILILFTLSVIISINLQNKIQSQFVKSQITYTPMELYEVKLSEQEAKTWVVVSNIYERLNPGQTKYVYFYWNKPYDTQLKISTTVNIIPVEYYNCYWYECVDCEQYKYDYCKLFQCVLQEGTPYIKCQRTEIRQWECVKQISTIQKITKTYNRIIYVRDGPDVFDWGDPDYFEVPVNDYPWNALATDPAELNYFSLTIRLYVSPEQAECLANATFTYGIRAYDAKIIYEDGTEQIIDRVGFGVSLTEAVYAYMTIDGTALYRKRISRIEIWEQDFDISRCGFATNSQINGALEFYGEKTVSYTDVQYVTKTQKTQLEQQGYTCTPYITETVLKTFTNPPSMSCNIVQYTSNPNLDGICENNVCYWYCNPEFECSYPPALIESGEIQQQITYNATTKQELYAKGCSDVVITCVSWGSKVGTLQEYQTDVYNREARNPVCYRWGTTTYVSLTDKTKVTGEPPFTQCTYKSQISKELIQNANCEGPIKDTIKEPALLEVKEIRREYYSSTKEDTIYIDVRANERISLLLKGATFSTFEEGSTIFTITIEALETNPYVISQAVEDISPEDKTYIAKRYIATIYSPGDLMARFYPPVCSEFEAQGLKFRFTYLNGESIPVDICKEGAILRLKKGTNNLEIVAYSINPRRFPSCIEKPKTCEKEDLYGCPEQCKVQNIRVECPTQITIKSGRGEAPIKIKVYGESDGYIRVLVEGKGVYYFPKIFEIKEGSNIIEIKPKYYYYVRTSETTVWRIIIENPAYYRPDYKADIEYCEITVAIIPETIWEILTRPEFLLSIVIIIVGIILMIRYRFGK